jgi:hypothetical protein
METWSSRLGVGAQDYQPCLYKKFKRYRNLSKKVVDALCFSENEEGFFLLLLLLSLAPQPSLGLDLLHKTRLNFLEASQQFSFYRVGLLAPRPTSIPEGQASVCFGENEED